MKNRLSSSTQTTWLSAALALAGLAALPTQAQYPSYILWGKPLMGASFLEGANVTMTAGVTDHYHLLTAVEFYANSNLLASVPTTTLPASESATATFAWSNVVSGFYELNAHAVFTGGMVRTSGWSFITVGTLASTNTPPALISVLNVADWTRVLSPVNATFIVQNVGRGAALTNMALYAGPDLVAVRDKTVGGKFATNRFTMTCTLSNLGDYLMILRGIDTLGRSILSAPIHLSVEATTNLPAQGVFNSGLSNRPAEAYFFLPTGVTYTVQSSTNLLAWTTLATVVNTNGLIWCTDPAATNRARSYYRAVPQP